jgi:hypothetical protein
MSQDELKQNSKELVGTVCTADIWRRLHDLQSNIEDYYRRKNTLAEMVNSNTWYRALLKAKLQVHTDNKGHELPMDAKQTEDVIRLFEMAVNLKVYNLHYDSYTIEKFNAVTMVVTSLVYPNKEVYHEANPRTILRSMMNCYDAREIQTKEDRELDSMDLRRVIQSVSYSTIAALQLLGMPLNTAQHICRQPSKKHASSVQIAADADADRYYKMTSSAWIVLLVQQVMLLYTGDDIQVRQTLRGGPKFVYSQELQDKQSLFEQENRVARRKSNADRHAAYQDAMALAKENELKQKRLDTEALRKYQNDMRQNDLRRWVDYCHCTRPDRLKREIVCKNEGCPMAVARGAPGVCLACCMWWMRVNNRPLTRKFVDNILQHARPEIQY